MNYELGVIFEASYGLLQVAKRERQLKCFLLKGILSGFAQLSALA
jgi:hypothetical protein